MVRVPRGLHSPAGAYRPGKLAWGPAAPRPARRLPMQLYQARISQVPLVGGQAQGIVAATGKLSLSVGPQGIGNVWYPASLTVQTTSGTSDGSVCNIYLGPAGVGVTLLGTFYPGQAGDGVASFALPSLAPGQYLIASWTGANSGDVATVNVVGTMDSVAPA